VFFIILKNMHEHRPEASKLHPHPDFGSQPPTHPDSGGDATVPAVDLFLFFFEKNPNHSELT
jgi:hypothetical protein